MTPRPAAALLAALLLAACGSDPDTGTDPSGSLASPEPAAGPASLDNPLGDGTLGTDAFVVRDAVVEAVREAGGVRVEVTGPQVDTGVALVYAPEKARFARVFTWQAGGQAMELLELAGGRVCANRAAAQALESSGSSGMGYLEASDRPYSCTGGSDGIAGFLMYGHSALDPVTRLAGLMGEVSLDDLGVEDQDDDPVRHLQVHATESNRSLRPVPSTLDLWVDGELRLVSAELSNLEEDGGTFSAAFSYGDLPTVELPADRGEFVFQPGTGPGPRP